MHPINRAALSLSAALALAIAGCSTPPPPPEPVAVAPVYTPPTLALNAGVAEAAAIYLGYMRDASQITAGFDSAQSIQTALSRSAASEPGQMSRGIVAYAAILALQEPRFVDGVRNLGTNPANREQMIRQILSDPAYAAQLPGAEAAAGLIVAQLNADGQAVFRVGQVVKQDAYDIQRNSDPRSRWARQNVSDLQGRLDRTKAVSATPLAYSSVEASRLHQAAQTGSGLQLAGGRAAPPYTQAVVRGLAIAALATLGAAGEDNRSATEALMVETETPFCFNMSKLNLFQCLAVSRPNFEDVFCMGQHVLMDTGQCVMGAAGALAPADAGSLTAPGTPAPVVAATPVPASG
ncbi:MAG TPA: hypothetical protein VGB49_05885, partial [Caulobacteraceae bacterium]